MVSASILGGNSVCLGGDTVIIYTGRRPMLYVSTRGNAAHKEFLDILLEGLAPDGGLYMPKSYPVLDLKELRTCGYRGIALAVLKAYAPDIPHEDLVQILVKTYTAEVFGSREITPVKMLDDNIGLLQLSGGPTLAFKDVPLQLLGNLMEYALEKKDVELNVLGATSGDTGSAAIYALRGKSRVRLFMLSPLGRMSRFQQRQMYTVEDHRIHNLVVDGTFDDCQAIVKEVNADAGFKKRYSLGAVNSINWARIAAQIVYYVWGYIQATKRNTERLSVVVPSGNFGNALSAYIAREMGLPIDIVIATNENDVLHEFFSSGGVYRVRKGSEVHVTSSPSMDIASASNFERLIFDLSDRNPRRVRKLWDDLAANGSFNADFLDPSQRSGMVSGKATEQQVAAVTRTIYDSFKTIVDPHTAVGLAVGIRFRKPGQKMLVAETAQPAKFEDAIRAAIGVSPPVPEAYAKMATLPEYVTNVKADVRQVKDFIARHAE